jgi:hypothetical protein
MPATNFRAPSFARIGRALPSCHRQIRCYTSALYRPKRGSAESFILLGFLSPSDTRRRRRTSKFPAEFRHSVQTERPLCADTVARVDSSMFSLLQGPVGSTRQPMVDFSEERCGPSRRRVQNAPADLKNFVGQSKKNFSTLSATSGRPRLCQKTFLRASR